MAAAVVAALCTPRAARSFPDYAYEPQHHNPFPQLSRVAVLPFNNLSDEPTLDGVAVADAYYNELQQIPGFEVMPVRAAVALSAKHAWRADERGDRFPRAGPPAGRRCD